MLRKILLVAMALLVGGCSAHRKDHSHYRGYSSDFSNVTNNIIVANNSSKLYCRHLEIMKESPQTLFVKTHTKVFFKNTKEAHLV